MVWPEKISVKAYSPLECVHCVQQEEGGRAVAGRPTHTFKTLPHQYNSAQVKFLVNNKKVKFTESHEL
jgi:hypothetical protein